MFKKLFFILCSITFLFTSLNGAKLSGEKFEIIASNINNKNNIITAVGDVVIFSLSYYGTAKKVIYDKNKETFELFGDVLIIKNNSIQAQSQYAFLDSKRDILFQEPSLIFKNVSNLWINSKKSNKKQEFVNLEKSILSSCDCEDPAWSVKASSITYNTDTKWINLFNPRLYIKNIPIMYSPYFGFSTDDKRRSGLLMPKIGYGGKEEGAIYFQPIYFAPKLNYDIEIIPQIRTKRGEGVYSYFRYKDTKYSDLKVKAGFFKEKKSYYEKNFLENQKHFGWGINYLNSKIFSNKNSQDGLYLDISWLNDFEYENLEGKDHDNNKNEKKKESKINYFYNTSKYYTGSYFRYYLDKTLESNDTTMQKIPQVHLHKYSNSLFLDNLLYSIDTKYTNYYRVKGIRANKYDINLPVSYAIPFFDDYLQINLKNETIFNHYKYNNDGKTSFKDGTFIENISTIGVNTDILKPYENFIHTLNLSANYINSKTLVKQGDLYDINDDRTKELSPFPITKTKRFLEFLLNESFYSKSGLNEIVNHKLKQSIVFDNYNNPKLDNLENEVVYNYPLGKISNKLTYNYQDKTFIENSTSLTFNYNNLDLDLGYYSSKKTPNSSKDDLESYRVNANYKIFNDYKIGYYTNYNLKENLRNKEGLLLSIMDKCWQIELKYEREIEAISSTIYDSKRQDILYIQFVLKPIGGISQQYTVHRTQD